MYTISLFQSDMPFMSCLELLHSCSQGEQPSYQTFLVLHWECFCVFSSVCGFLSVQVDKHIRRLDADLARFEADLKDKLEGSDFESSGSRNPKSV